MNLSIFSAAPGSRHRRAGLSRSTRFLERYGPWGVVIGASRGVGAWFARELAANGLNVLLVARSKERLESVAAEIRERNGTEAKAVVLDLADAGAVTTLEREIAAIDAGLLIYNAGPSNAGPFLDRPVASHLETVAVNVDAVVQAVAGHISRLAGRRTGGIILMSSMTAFVGSPAVAAYGSSRAFVESLGEAIGYEQRHEGLDFLVCNAGVIRERKARTTPASIRESLVRPPVSRPDAVARAAIRALGRRRVVVPGTRSALLSVLLRRLVPTRWMVRLMAWTVSTLHIDDYELEQRESH